MTSSRTTPEAFQDTRRQPKYGFCNYARHRSLKAVKISPSDVDAMYHSRKGNRFFAVEFKTTNEAPPVTATREEAYAALKKRMGGQFEMLQEFSKYPNHQSMILFDPYWNDLAETRIPPLTLVSGFIFRDGRMSALWNTTVGQWSDHMWDWQQAEGKLFEPIIHQQRIIRQMTPNRAEADKLIEALGLNWGR